MLRILQARLHQYVNWELLDLQAEFRKGRGNRNQIALIHWITEKCKTISGKKINFCSIDYAKPLIFWITTCGKFLKRWKYQITLPVSWETCMMVKKQQL